MITGKVISIKGQIVEVEFLETKPRFNDVLTFKEDPQVRMEVYRSASPNSFFCLVLTNVTKLHHGSIVVSTEQPIRIPVGQEMLGRVINTLGEPQDGMGEITTLKQESNLLISLPLLSKVEKLDSLEELVLVRQLLFQKLFITLLFLIQKKTSQSLLVSVNEPVKEKNYSKH
jgi:F0F1-type ATP synthase beta subunit